MSLFGASRFTVLLAAIAGLGTAGSLWWAISTRADLKSNASGRSADRVSAPKSPNHVVRPKGERPNRSASFRRNDRSQPTTTVGNDDRDQGSERSVAPQILADYVSPSLQSSGADMPLPVPPDMLSGPETWQTKPPEPAVFAAPQPSENQKRLTRDPRPESASAIALPNPPKPGRSYYIEKIAEQDDAGEVKYRYRRHPCEPPNMPDVCFMPQESRRNIVVERQVVN